MYIISNFGDVKGISREIIDTNGKKKIRKQRVMTQMENKDGYLTVKLSKNGHSKRYPVHVLVAKTFIDDRQYKDGWEVNHIDMNRKNNRVDNLEWLTHKQNIEHSVKYGKYKRYGSRNSNYKNDTLKKYFAEHPEAKKKQSRSGSQNGTSIPVAMYNQTGFYKEFDYIGACCKYMIEKGLSSSLENSLRNTIKRRMEDPLHKPYHGYCFKYIK